MLDKTSLLHVIATTLEEKSPAAMVTATMAQHPDIIKKPGPIKIFALGKASLPMTEGFCAAVEHDRITAALVISHQVDTYESTLPKHFDLCYSPHPLSTRDSLTAAEKAIQFFTAIEADDNLICLISGGGSSMMMMPVDGISFDEKKHLIDNLIRQGIPEREVNEIRKSLSKVKGGKLLSYLPDMSIENVFLSDERQHKFDAIASGPTIAAHDHLAHQVIDTYLQADDRANSWIELAIAGNKPPAISASIEIHNTICGTRNDVIDGLKANLEGIANVAKVWCEYEVIHSIPPADACALIIKKLEATMAMAGPGQHVLIIPAEIQVKADPNAKGGRNQHLTAMMMQRLKPDVPFSFMAYASDGVDFLEGVAGAYFDSTMTALIANKASDIEHAIATTTSYNLHQDLGTLVEGDKTGHNISDLIIISFEHPDR